MTQFFNKSQVVNVSRITVDGWWVENTQEHVVKGTALGRDFTLNVYTPSRQGKTAKYDRESDTWSDEIDNMMLKPFYDVNGVQFVVNSPDAPHPEWAVTIAPPEYNALNQTVLFTKEAGWVVYDIKIGTPYYDEFGVKLTVSGFNFSLPENGTFDPPPETQKGQAVKRVDDEWLIVDDHRGKVAYSKDRNHDSDFLVDTLDDIPETHTMDCPQAFDSWDEDAGWTYDIERHRPVKEQLEREWRDTKLSDVLNRIDQYEKDQNYPEELRTSPLSAAQFQVLLSDRKVLSDYPQTADFPFCERPELSGQ